MKRASLIEKSATARRVGGAEAIRKFSKPDRLMVSAEIANELGRRKAKRSCASKYFYLMKEKGTTPPELAGIAMHYGLRPEMREAISLQAEGDSALAFWLSNAQKHFRSGKKEEGRAAAIETIRGQLTEVDPRISRALCTIYRIKYREIKPVAISVFRKKMDEGDFESAYLVAREWRLFSERRTATIASIHSEMSKGRFESAKQKAGTRGIGKKGLRSIAKQVFSQHIQDKKYPEAALVAENFRVIGGAQEAAEHMYTECMEENRYLEAAQIAKHYGLIPQMKSAALELINSTKERSLVFALKYAREFELDGLARELGKRLVEVEALLANYAKAIQLAEELGFDTKKIARAWFEAELENNSSTKALFIAKRYGLEEEKRMIGKRMFQKQLALGNTHATRRLLSELGLVEEQQQFEELLRLRKRSKQPRR